MKRNLIAACAALAMVLALGGCSNTGEIENTASPSPTGAVGGSTSPSPSPSGAADGGSASTLPNNAGGTANGATGTRGMGDYRADVDGDVNGAGGSARSLLRDAGDAVGDAARDTGRAVGDVGRAITGGR